MAFKNEIGNTYGYLTVISRAENAKNRQAQWLCQCKCGNEIIVRGDSLRSGHTTSCGCYQKEPINEIGNTYGYLTVIELAQSDKDCHAMWKCKCKCGNEIIVRGASLRSGNTTSCGCYQKEQATQNEIGNIYGYLTVISRAESDKGRRAQWLCKCKCGNEIIVSGASLRNGNTTSCGCIRSKGEVQIEQLLKEHQINYKREYTFDDLKDQDLLRFDFAIFDGNQKLVCLIEFQGEQHWKTSSRFYSDILIKHNNMKIAYCK